MLQEGSTERLVQTTFRSRTKFDLLCDVRGRKHQTRNLHHVLSSDKDAESRHKLRSPCYRPSLNASHMLEVIIVIAESLGRRNRNQIRGGREANFEDLRDYQNRHERAIDSRFRRFARHSSKLRKPSTSILKYAVRDHDHVQNWESAYAILSGSVASFEYKLRVNDHRLLDCRMLGNAPWKRNDA